MQEHFLCPAQVFSFPKYLTPDIVHVLSSNIPELVFSLFQGALLQCNLNNNPRDWPFATLQDADLFPAFDLQVESGRPYIPNSMENAPQTIVKKINSGYKCWEFCIVFWESVSGFLRKTLPNWQYKHLCKLIFAV
jgi:hypothetical protein